MENGHTARVFGLGLLVGLAAGVTVGILYAPQSGKQTRHIIDDKFDDARRKAEKIIEEAKEEAEKVLKSTKAKIS